MTVHAPRVAAATAQQSSKVQGAQNEPSLQTAADIRALETTLLELELAHPVAIGGSLGGRYGIDDDLAVLRRSEVESMLGRVDRAHSIGEVTNSAGAVFAAVQEHLLTFAGGDDVVHDYPSVWRVQSMTKHALRDRLGTVKTVRMLQEEATDGNPLTVCFGLNHRNAYEVALGVGDRALPARDLRALAQREFERGNLLALPRMHMSHGDGCGRAHRESPSRLRLFKLYCDNCKTGSGNRQRKFEAMYRARVEGRQPGEAVCRCGTTFARAQPTQTRCPQCRARHRSL